MAELRAVFGSGEKKTLPLYGLPDQIVVGRGTASDWQLDDPSLSRKHCQFRWNGKTLSVEDLGSANGTRVGARSARQPVAVGPDDVVQLGTVMISFVPLSPSLTATSPIDSLGPSSLMIVPTATPSVTVAPLTLVAVTVKVSFASTAVSPSIVTEPDEGRSIPPRRLSNVDLPQPDGPTIAT